MICGSGREDRSCVGAVRDPVVDSGWLPRRTSRGSQETRLELPTLLEVGLSGWIQHLFGMKHLPHHCGEHGPRRPHFRSCGVRHQGSNWPTRSSGSPIVMDGLSLNATWADLGSRRQSCRMQELFKRTTQSRKRAAEIDPGSLYDIADRNRLIGLFQPRNQAWFKRGHSARDERRLKRRSRAGYSKRK